jgi:parvulin-like peptidyl-prolyl isomerase
MRPRRSASVTGLSALVRSGTLALSGCGNSGPDVPTPDTVPEESVAIVGEVSIIRAAYERRLASNARGISPLSGTESSSDPLDPPRFNRCIAALRRTLAEGQGEGTQPTALPARPQLREACAQRYEQVRLTTLSRLIEDQWLVQSAREAGLEVDDGEVSERLAGFETSRGGSPARSRERFRQLLRRSGLERGDIEAELAARLAQEQILAEQSDSLETPSGEELRDFYEENPQLFGKAGERVIEIVAVDDEETANEALERVEGGEEVRDVSAELSSNVAILAGDGVLSVTEGPGPLPGDLVDAVFSATEGELAGPVDADGSWYLFRVIDSTESEVPPFEEVQDRVLDSTKSAQLQRAQIEARNELQEQWRAKTLCAEDLLVAHCSNGPELPPLPVP